MLFFRSTVVTWSRSLSFNWDTKLLGNQFLLWFNRSHLSWVRKMPSRAFTPSLAPVSHSKPHPMLGDKQLKRREIPHPRLRFGGTTLMSTSNTMLSDSNRQAKTSSLEGVWHLVKRSSKKLSGIKIRDRMLGQSGRSPRAKKLETLRVPPLITLIAWKITNKLNSALKTKSTNKCLEALVQT